LKSKPSEESVAETIGQHGTPVIPPPERKIEEPLTLCHPLAVSYRCQIVNAGLITDAASNARLNRPLLAPGGRAIPA
jgi:hypothetical protein